VAAFCFAPAFAEQSGASRETRFFGTKPDRETHTPTPTRTDCWLDQSRAPVPSTITRELAIEAHDGEIVERLHKVS
jgi:hypothetical protein